MRTRKKLKWVREEDFDGLATYRSKRKTEKAIITKQPGGGYHVDYESKKCKRRVIVGNLTEARLAAESMRYSAPKRNPIPLPSKTMVYSAAVGAAVAVAILAWMESSAKAATTPSSAAPALPTTPAPTSVPVVLVGTPDQAVTSSGKEVVVTLPAGASWTYFNGTATGGTPITIPTPAAGTYLIGYMPLGGSSVTQTLLTVT